MDKKDLHTNPFKTPSGYFDQLHDQLMARVTEATLKHKVPSDGFTTPQGYIETLHNRILANTVKADLVPVRKMKPFTWVSYAAAACITIAIGIVALWQLPSQNTSFENHVANLSDTEIISYLEYYSEAGDISSISEDINIEPGSFTEQFSEDDIVSYLEQTL